MAAATKSANIELKPLNVRRIDVPIVGDSPLVVHAWSKKAMQQILDKQMKKAAGGRETRDPWRDFCESLYWLGGMPATPTEKDVEQGRFGFPCLAFKAAAVTGCTSSGAITKVAARQCFHIDGDLIPILGGPPSMRQDMVRIGMGTADIRFRGEFNPWAAILPIRYNADVLSAEQVVNLINLGGFACGVGEGRPERDGQNGRFHVADQKEMAPFLKRSGK